MKILTKFVTDLSPAEIVQLIEDHQTNRNLRVRYSYRLHAAFLSHQSYSIEVIAQIYRVQRANS